MASGHTPCYPMPGIGDHGEGIEKGPCSEQPQQRRDQEQQRREDSSMPISQAVGPVPSSSSDAAAACAPPASSSQVRQDPSDRGSIFEAEGKNHAAPSLAACAPPASTLPTAEQGDEAEEERDQHKSSANTADKVGGSGIGGGSEEPHPVISSSSDAASSPPPPAPASASASASASTSAPASAADTAAGADLPAAGGGGGGAPLDKNISSSSSSSSSSSKPSKSKSSSRKKSARGASVAERTAEWLTTGSPYIGLQVKRLVTYADPSKWGYGIASVIGWLPAEISEFVSEKTSQPAPLWRIIFDEAHLIESDHTSDSTRVEAFCELGMEDLEEDEVRIARALFLTHMRDAKELKYLSWYMCKEDETPTTVAKKLHVDRRLIVKLSKSQGPKHKNLASGSRMKAGSWLLIPPAIPYCERMKMETEERNAKKEKQKRKRMLEEDEKSVDDERACGDQAESEVVEQVEKLSSDADIKLTRKEHKRMSEVLASSLNSARRSTSPEVSGTNGGTPTGIIQRSPESNHEKSVPRAVKMSEVTTAASSSPAMSCEEQGDDSTEETGSRGSASQPKASHSSYSSALVSRVSNGPAPACGTTGEAAKAGGGQEVRGKAVATISGETDDEDKFEYFLQRMAKSSNSKGPARLR